MGGETRGQEFQRSIGLMNRIPIHVGIISGVSYPFSMSVPIFLRQNMTLHAYIVIYTYIFSVCLCMCTQVSSRSVGIIFVPGKLELTFFF